MFIEAGLGVTIEEIEDGKKIEYRQMWIEDLLFEEERNYHQEDHLYVSEDLLQDCPDTNRDLDHDRGLRLDQDPDLYPGLDPYPGRDLDLGQDPDPDQYQGRDRDSGARIVSRDLSTESGEY